MGGGRGNSVIWHSSCVLGLLLLPLSRPRSKVRRAPRKLGMMKMVTVVWRTRENISAAEYKKKIKQFCILAMLMKVMNERTSMQAS